MRTHSLALRLVWLCLAALHLAVPGAAELADARLVAETLAQGTHVESESHDCTTGGHPEQCAICQFLLSPADPPADVATVSLPRERAVAGAHPQPERAARPVPAGSVLPRAPPVPA